MAELPIEVEVWESHPISIGSEEIKRRLGKVFNVISCTEQNQSKLTEEEYFSLPPEERTRMNKTTCQGNVYILQVQNERAPDDIHGMIVEEILDNNKQPSIEEITTKIKPLGFKTTSVVGFKT